MDITWLAGRDVNSDQVETYLQSGSFAEAGLPGLGWNGGAVTRHLDETLAFHPDRYSVSDGILHVEDGWQGSTIGGGSLQHRLFVSLEACWNDTACDGARRRTNSALQDPGASVVIPSEVGVRHVYVGDANHDGATDVLVTFSNGGGMLFDRTFVPSYF